MIKFGDFTDISKKYDEVWMVVRSLKSMQDMVVSSLKNMPDINGPVYKQVQELSPSMDLFQKYLNWKKLGKWNISTFQNQYVPQFLNELCSMDAMAKLKELYQLGKQKNILVVCYCKNEFICHRSILYGIFLGYDEKYGCNITQGPNTSFGIDYLNYYTEYQKAQAENLFYLLVAGSRTYTDYNELKAVLDFLLQNIVRRNRIIIVSGGAKGADALAEQYAIEKGYESIIFPADWSIYGKQAGFIRNGEMHRYIAENAENNKGCICFWDGESKGTKQNFQLAKEYNNPLRVFNFMNKTFLSAQELSQE